MEEGKVLNYDTVARLSKGYDFVLREIKKVQPELPDVVIEAKNVSVIADVPIKEEGIETLYSHLIHKLSCKKPKTKTFDILKNVNLVIKPRTMTLVLAPPGHGKSALLKTLAGQLEPTEGKVTWNGFGKEFSDEKQLRVEKLCQYVDQVDVHLPHLTVRETFQFAVNNAFNPQEYNNADMDFVHAHKVDMILRQLGLEECADTIVGNELIRGVSGGQRKRVTMGEVMCSDARALFLDEVTSGLDASTAYDVFAAMRSWTDVLGTSCVAALLQPGPELFELFDNVILMRESQIVYAGPRSEVMDHFERHGLYCPPDQDFADYLVEFLSQPNEVYRKQLKKNLLPTSQSQRVQKAEVKEKVEEAKRRFSVSVSQTSHVSIHPSDKAVEMTELPHTVNAELSDSVEIMPVVVDPTEKKSKKQPIEPHGGPVPLTTASLAAAYHASPYFAEHQKILSSTQPKFDMSKLHPLVQRQYGGEFSHSYWEHSKSVLHRQVLYQMRNKGAIYPRLFQAVYMGLVIGSLFWNISIDSFTTRVSLIIFCMTALAFTSMVEVPATMEIKRNVFKHYSYRLYPPTAQIIAQMICHFPTALVETIIFSTLVYWMTSFSAEAGRFVVFIIIILVVNMAISTFFRFLAYIASKQEEAEAMVSPSVGVFMLFGGFLISRGDIPPWFIWLYWISPYSWAGRAAATNEFHAGRYDDTISGGRRGSVYLETWSMYDDDHWVYLGIIFQLVWYVLFSVLAAIAIKHNKIELSRGTKRLEEVAEEYDENAVVEVSTTKLKSALSCPPVTLAFKDLCFTVGKIGSGQEKVLLRNINGFAKPGTLTALMGASGAGKTTLMDVLAGRKTQGLIEGQILVNGQPKVDASFNRIAGYVEQMDSHIPTATVYESLLFSAQLRLPASVTEEQRREVVEETMELLELTDIRDRIVGESEELGLSPGQLKRLTMGVELVANPSVLFLDEPTTGLDSRTALHIVRVIRKVARTGRSVVCTIHQPSAEVFFLFDRMLLLQSGGFPVFFGELGPKAIHLEKYLTEIPGVDERPVEQNPASWMLDVIGAGTALGKATKAMETGSEDAAPQVVVEAPDANTAHVHNHAKERVERFNEIYKQSALFRQNELALDEAVQVDPTKLVVADTGYGASFWKQYKAVQDRCFRSHWRNIPYNFTRLFMSLLMSVIFGLIWFDVDDSDQIGLNSKMASMFMGGAFGAMLSCSPQMHALYKQRAAFYRERASRTYSSFAYSTAIGVTELPFFALCSILFVIPLYFLVGFNHNAGDFFRYLLTHFMLTMCMGTIAQLLIAMFPTVIIAQIFMGTVITFIFLFAGMFIGGPSIPDGWYWIHEIDPMRYVLQMFYATQFHCEGSSCTQISFLVGADTKLMTARQFLEQSYGIDFDGFWFSGFTFLVVYIAILRILIALAMQFIAHIKR